MGVLEDIKIMQQEGRPSDEIRTFLEQRGISGEEADRYIAQANIKGAVVADNVPSPSFDNSGFSKTQEDYTSSGAAQQDYEEMQPSMLVPQQETQEIGEQYSGEYPAYQQQNYYEQAQYQPYQEAISSDVITAIAEQVVDERLSFLNEKLEKAVDFKTTAETKISNLSERLVRIEQILDKLQIALLQKVGEYVQDVADIKKELVETQKSFKTISQGHHMRNPSSINQHRGSQHFNEHSSHTKNEKGKHRP